MIAVFRRKNNVLIFKLLLLILSLEFIASNKLKLKNFSFELPYHLIQMTHINSDVLGLQIH